MRLTVGLCIRWRAINNRLGGVCAVKEGKVEQLFRKRPSHGIPCKACVWFGRKGRVPLENRGKCLTHLTDLSPCVPMSGQDVYLQAVCGTKCSLAFFFSVSGRKKRHVLSQMFHWGAHHRQKWSRLGGSRMKLEQASNSSLSLSLGTVRFSGAHSMNYWINSVQMFVSILNCEDLFFGFGNISAAHCFMSIHKCSWAAGMVHMRIPVKIPQAHFLALDIDSYYHCPSVH